jgi:hypothetical protein
VAVSYGKKERGRATRLHSLIVRRRAGGICQRCEKAGTLQCAHILSRAYANTRTDEDNAVALCGRCAWFFNKNPVEFATFVFEKVGRDRYADLFAKATSGRKMDWKAEADRLAAVWAAMNKKETA